jgi:alkaline phosphatase
MTITGGDISAGTVEATFSTEDHTAVMIPVFAFGPGAEKFSGIYENTAIFSKMMNAFGFKTDN